MASSILVWRSPDPPVPDPHVMCFVGDVLEDGGYVWHFLLDWWAIVIIVFKSLLACVVRVVIYNPVQMSENQMNSSI